MVHARWSGAPRAAAGLLVVACSWLVACGGTALPTGTDPFQGPPSATLTVPPPVPHSVGSCTPGSPIVSVLGGDEVQGINERGLPVYALFASPGIQPLTTLAVWWHVPGDGPFRITLVGPNDRIEQVEDTRPGVLAGWDRPGEPWEAHLAFPSEGCWRVYFMRGRVAGDLWVNVA
jgi:hypothetical protein